MQENIVEFQRVKTMFSIKVKKLLVSTCTSASPITKEYESISSIFTSFQTEKKPAGAKACDSK